MGLIIGGVSARDLILDGQSVSLYVGGSPPTKVWPTRETVQITLGVGQQARDQFRAALSARGLDYRTVTEIPFDIELVGGAGYISELTVKVNSAANIEYHARVITDERGRHGRGQA